ncbi:MAG: hypothetical protein ACC628_15435, partial [Pirellulaceae bacterium]
ERTHSALRPGLSRRKQRLACQLAMTITNTAAPAAAVKWPISSPFLRALLLAAEEMEQGQVQRRLTLGALHL